MAEFPIATISAVRMDVLNDRLVLTLHVPCTPDDAADVLAEAQQVRRLYTAQLPVAVTVRPCYEQLSLLPDRHAAPDAGFEDRPSGESVDDFLAGEDT